MEIIITIKEDGNESVNVRVEKPDGVIKRDAVSQYSRFFDEGCKMWTKDAEYNMLYLRSMQNYANDLLKARGYVFLNEVYDLLGFPRTKEGQLVGWVYNENGHTGDNFIDFDIYAERSKDFVNGITNSPLLDFNVDGCIIDQVDDKIESK